MNASAHDTEKTPDEAVDNHAPASTERRADDVVAPPPRGPSRRLNVVVVAATFSGVALIALAAGALAGNLASVRRVAVAVAVVTALIGFIGGLLAEPLVRRAAARRSGDGQSALESRRRT